MKSGSKIKSLQVEMDIEYTDALNKKKNYFKTSWVGMDEIQEFTEFVENYVIRILKKTTESGLSTTYHFDAKELVFVFEIRVKISEFLFI